MWHLERTTRAKHLRPSKLDLYSDCVTSSWKKSRQLKTFFNYQWQDPSVPKQIGTKIKLLSRSAFWKVRLNYRGRIRQITDNRKKKKSSPARSTWAYATVVWSRSSKVWRTSKDSRVVFVSEKISAFSLSSRQIFGQPNHSEGKENVHDMF